MKFRHNKKYGKHSFILNDNRLFRKILATTKTIDMQSRIIPTQFGRIKSSKTKFKLKLNSCNCSEIFIQISKKKWFQRLKIECSSVQTAHRILEKLSQTILCN